MAKEKALPKTGIKEKELPPSGRAENTVIINGDPIEIKATKLRYIRNGTANLFRLLERMPINDLVMLPAGAFGEGDDRDGDKALMDWLIAATDNEEFVVGHYDDFTTEQILRILDIFLRVNKFLSKEAEESLKNALTPREESQSTGG